MKLKLRFPHISSFPDPEEHKTHRKTVHNIICVQCGKSCSVESHASHVRHHHPETEPTLGDRTCEICGKVAKTPSALYLHRRNYHWNRTYSCKQCDFTAKTPSMLSNHVTTKHKEKKRFECAICHKYFWPKTCLNDHMATHTGERNYACKYCDAKFGAATNYYKHRKVAHPDEYALWKISRSA